MVLHPQARRAVEAQAGEMKVHDPAYDVAAAREEDRRVAAEQPREAVLEVRAVDADGVPCRLYRPSERTDALVVHLHGGGFVFNDVDVHDAAVRTFANRVGVPVLSVDYRRPPEHRFPAAPDDVDQVVAWVRDGGLGEVPRLVVHGDSAGANLALVAALRNPGAFEAAVLIYPFLDPEQGFDSYADAAGFDPEEAAWYWRQYAATEADLVDPDLAPLRSTQLHTMPPTLVVTAEHDPLRGEGEHLFHLLAEAGVEVVGTRALGQVHGFWRHTAAFDAAEPLHWQAAGFVQMVLSRPGRTNSTPA